MVFSTRSNLVQSVTNAGKLGKSDHALILIELTGKLRASKTEEDVPDWSKADMTELKRLLSEVDWDTKLVGNTNECWDVFKSILQEAQNMGVYRARRGDPFTSLCG